MPFISPCTGQIPVLKPPHVFYLQFYLSLHWISKQGAAWRSCLLHLQWATSNEGDSNKNNNNKCGLPAQQKQPSPPSLWASHGSVFYRINLRHKFPSWASCSQGPQWINSTGPIKGERMREFSLWRLRRCPGEDGAQLKVWSHWLCSRLEQGWILSLRAGGSRDSRAQN